MYNLHRLQATESVFGPTGNAAAKLISPLIEHNVPDELDVSKIFSYSRVKH
jgi:hypothetical protein